MKRNIRRVAMLLIFLTGSLLSTGQAEDVNVSTYYPSPYGKYQNLETTRDTYLATLGGMVGINTASPTAPLTVRSALSSYGQIRIVNPNTDGEASIGFRDASDTDATSWLIGKNLASSQPDGVNSLGISYGGTTLMTVTYFDRKLGLGTSGPDEAVHISKPDPKMIIRDTDPANRFPSIHMWLSGEYIFEGDDTQAADSIWHFYSYNDVARPVDAEIRVHGSYTSSPPNMNIYLGVKHDGTNGAISTDLGNIFLTPQSTKAVQITAPGQSPFTTFKPLNVAGGDICISENNYFRFVNNSGSPVKASIGSDSSGKLRFLTGSPGTERMRITGSGNVEIGPTLQPAPASLLWVSGDAKKEVGTGEWNSTSDIHLKKDIGPLEGALDKMLQLRAVTFKWKEPAKHGNTTGTEIGFTAQDVEKVFPHWVSSGPDGTKMLNYRGIEALAVEAIRELKAKHEKLEKRNEELAARLAALEKQNPARSEKKVLLP